MVLCPKAHIEGTALSLLCLWLDFPRPLFPFAHHRCSKISIIIFRMLSSAVFSCLKFGHRRIMLCGLSSRSEPISIKICQKDVSNDVCILSSIFNYVLQLTISGNFPEVFLKVFPFIVQQYFLSVAPRKAPINYRWGAVNVGE